jgi:hypothetical protein
LHLSGIVARGIQLDPGLADRSRAAELAELFVVARDSEITVARCVDLALGRVDGREIIINGFLGRSSAITSNGSKMKPPSLYESGSINSDAAVAAPLQSARASNRFAAAFSEGA